MVGSIVTQCFKCYWQLLRHWSLYEKGKHKQTQCLVLEKKRMILGTDKLKLTAYKRKGDPNGSTDLGILNKILVQILLEWYNVPLLSFEKI